MCVLDYVAIIIKKSILCLIKKINPLYRVGLIYVPEPAISTGLFGRTQALRGKPEA